MFKMTGKVELCKFKSNSIFTTSEAAKVKRSLSKTDTGLRDIQNGPSRKTKLILVIGNHSLHLRNLSAKITNTLRLQIRAVKLIRHYEGSPM